MNTAPLDHVVLATPDLDATLAWFAEQTGIVAAPGGSHVGLGTRNCLVDLGNGGYLEIVGTDADQPAPACPRPFGVDDLDAPRIVTWAIRPDDLDATVAAARVGGYDPGDPSPMSRRSPDGELLEWRLTPPTLGTAEVAALVPFLIDWGSTTHPAARGLPRTPMLSLTATHPDPDGVRAKLATLGADLTVAHGPLGFTLVVAGRNGEPVTLH